MSAVERRMQRSNPDAIDKLKLRYRSPHLYNMVGEFYSWELNFKGIVHHEPGGPMVAEDRKAGLALYLCDFSHRDENGRAIFDGFEIYDRRRAPASRGSWSTRKR